MHDQRVHAISITEAHCDRPKVIVGLLRGSVKSRGGFTTRSWGCREWNDQYENFVGDFYALSILARRKKTL
jgi:hypothetical protein